MADIIIKDPNGELGGAGLPEVDSGDNGKVLTVVSGEWAPATASGGTAVPKIAYATAADGGIAFIDSNGNSISYTDIRGLQYVVIDTGGPDGTCVVSVKTDGDGNIVLDYPLSVDADGDIVRTTFTFNKTNGAFISSIQKRMSNITWLDY